jgi:uncharacterized protein
MGIKYLLLIGAIAGIVFLMRNARHRRLEQGRRQAHSGTQSTTRMRRCAHCGLHIPETEAVRRDEEYFCCREHADLGKS